MLDLSHATDWQRSLAVYAILFIVYVIVCVVVVIATLVTNVAFSIALLGDTLVGGVFALLTAFTPVSAVIVSAVSGDSLLLWLNLPWAVVVLSVFVLRLVASRMKLLGADNA